ncbi:uncharacterized protein LOC125686699 [Lagopus muta]|uniref:uncharacterized protein LOC125686699 n=1 Tax=Lagopus muta TaxID=64668 RepID=UPI0020A0E0FB|nr:uncharacterized protein LOC125686699 [Lagopus muta]
MGTAIPFIICCNMIIALSSAFWIPAQPKQNVWVTLANKMGQDTLCLSTASPGNPFSCLVGQPLDKWPIPNSIAEIAFNTSAVVDKWDGWVLRLQQSNLEPQELELLGSVKMDYCLYFNYSGKNQSLVQCVNSSLAAYRNHSAWCNYTSPNFSRSSSHPLSLPAGVFLICGDRAWSAIPSHIKGGPCSLGRLTLLTPNISMITHHQKRFKQAGHAFQSECKDNVEFWNPGGIAAASFLAPGVASVKALSTLKKLGCWLAKQTNATSLALSGLLLDKDSVQHATLQNRAAINFLLLAQGHGCQDFDGMCCMNLSEHPKSIYKSIQDLQKGVKKLQVDDRLDIFGSFFRNPGVWIQNVLKIGLVCLIAFLCILVCTPCLLQCARKMIQALNHAFFISKEGRDVGDREVSSASSSPDLLVMRLRRGQRV